MEGFGKVVRHHLFCRAILNSHQLVIHLIFDEKNRIFMWRVRFELDARPFFSSNLELMLSWYTTAPCTSCPCSLRNMVVHNTSSASIRLDFLPMIMELKEAFPYRTTSNHYCFRERDNLLWLPTVVPLLSTRERVRTRIHFGTW